MKRILFGLIAVLIVSCTNKKEVDTIIYSGKVYTCTRDSNRHYTAIAIKDGKIVELGSKEDIESNYSAKEILDLPTAYVYPGFIDAHCHFSGYALDKYKCDLTGTTSFQQVIEKLIAYEQSNTLPWIYGRGWDQNDWGVKTFPDKSVLDSLFPDKPVILKRVDGHAVLCNQKALEMAKINSDTRIVGGMTELKNGKPTGILIDNATEPVEQLIGSLPENEAQKYLQQAENECLALGLTGVVECGVKAETIELLQKLYTNKLLNIGNTVQLASDSVTLSKYVAAGPIYSGQLQISGIKVYGDGALGSRGACLIKDYTDMPGHKGMLLTSMETMKKIAQDATRYGWQLCTHAIGDSANRTILKLYADYLKGKNDKRWRIEHAQVVNKADLHYFADYNIIPSVQPTHATSDMPWAEDRLGHERINDAYAYKELLQTNGWIPLGTDFPVEGINPLATFYAAVVRKDRQGNPANGFMPQNALSRQEALMGITIWAAKSVFLEKTKGSLEIGKDADIVILDKDIMTTPEKELLNTKVRYTIIKGKTKYQSK